MTYLFDKAFQITLMLIFLLIFFLFMIIGIAVLGRMKRKNKKEEDDYYQTLERYDAKDYLDFEDIADEMVIMDNHRRFVGAIRCDGYDYYSASSAQQASTMRGYLEFLRTITSPVTYRQYFVRMSMDHTRSMYAKRYEEVERELFHKNVDRDGIVERLNIVRGIDLVAEEALLMEAESLQKEITNLDWRRMHLKEQIDFMDMVCDESSLEPDIEQVYLVEWEFQADKYNMELSEEDIHKKAIAELDGICRRMIAALGQANVRAYRCSTAELIEMFYQQSHPLSAMEFKMPDVVNSPYFEFVTTTDDFEKKCDTAYKDAVILEGIRMAQAVEELDIENPPKEEVQKDE